MPEKIPLDKLHDAIKLAVGELDGLSGPIIVGFINDGPLSADQAERVAEAVRAATGIEGESVMRALKPGEGGAPKTFAMPTVVGIANIKSDA